MRKVRLLLVIAHGTLAMPALAEIEDKLPSQIELWTWPPGIALAAFALGRIHPWLALLPWPVGIVWAYVMLSETWALFSALQSGLGSNYVVAVYVASVVASFAPPLLATWFHFRRRDRQRGR